MKRVGEFIVLFSAFLGFCAATSPCGPGGKCKCFNYTQNATEMRCSKALKLKTICASFGNGTIHNVIRLISKLNDTILTSDDLIGCESLRELCLTKNAIRHVQEKILMNMSKLTFLDLSLNHLDVYRTEPSYEFWLPPNLRILKLNGNVPEHVDTSHMRYPVFYPSNVLRHLYLDGLPNKIIDVFRGEPNLLQGVTMSGLSGYCNLLQVTKTTFGTLHDLTFLNISSCSIDRIEFGAIKELRKLEVFDFSHNRQLGLKALENISHGLQFTNIKSFNFSHVSRKFGPARTVEKRDLCYLWNTSLQELVMEGNRIEMVESNALIMLPLSLELLRIGYNRLTVGIYIFQIGCMSKLTDLHSGFLDVSVFHEKLTEIIDNISKDEDDCRENQTASTCPFMSTSYLKNISLSKQNCVFYDGSTVPLSIPQQIKNVYSPQCGFVTTLLSILNHASSLDLPLERLDVSGNKIYQIPSLNITFKNLKYLDLSDNHCKSLAPRSGYSVPNLEHLNIQKNLLGFSISERHFTHFGNLRILNLSDNVLQNLSKHVFLNLTNLEVLDLSDNKIQNWTADVKDLKSLKHLNLSNNVIEYLPPYLTSRLEGRSNFSVDLQNNTIRCVCKYKDFLAWLVRYKHNMVGYKHYLFRDEDDQELCVHAFEHKVLHLNKFCGSYTGLIVVASLFLMTFLFVILGGLLYRNRWQIRYFVYITKRKYSAYKRVPDEDTEEQFKYDAFISYAEDNNQFISEELIPKLEQQGVSLCVHQRDFVPGHSVIDNIIGAIQNSNKTVVILSREFINSRWCMYEFQMARMESIYSRDNKVCLLIVMKDNMKLEEMPLEMINWLRYESYLEYTEQAEGELLFWERLIETLKNM